MSDTQPTPLSVEEQVRINRLPLDALLSELAVALPRELLKRIAAGTATAADLQAARQTLKDNDIQSVPGSNPSLDTLALKLGDVDLPDPIPFRDGTSG